MPISKHNSLVRRREVRPTFEIELREDDLEILQKIQSVIGCGKIYHLKFHRYDKWKPHVKLKVTRIDEIQNILIPFFDAHPLIAKKRKSYAVFKRIVAKVARKEHLTEKGLKEIIILRDQMNK